MTSPHAPPTGTHCRRSIVAFHRSLLRADRARLQQEFGLALTDYRPEFTYVESVSSDRGAQLELEPLVRAVVPFPRQLRRPSGGGRGAFHEALGRGDAAGTMEAVLFEDADLDIALQALRHRGATDPVVIDDRRQGGALRIRFGAGDAAADEMVEVDDVRWLDEVGKARLDTSPPTAAAPVMVSGAGRSSLPVARAWVQPLWDLGLTGRGQVIGMMDSPVDLEHAFFADPVHPVGRQHRKIVGYRNASGRPPARHGTFVAGIAVGDDPARPGADPGRGIAWAARLTYGNFNDLDQKGVLTYLAAAADDDARVHTNSWHDEPEIQYNQLAADVDAFSWYHEDHLVIGSAANHREAIGPPGTAKNTLAVAASRGTHPDEFGDGASGPTPDGRLKPEVMAPGCSIRSAVSGTGQGVELNQVVFDQPGPVCASSWAAPAVAGLAALVRQYYTEGRHPTGTARPEDAITPSGALLRATILAGCRAESAEGYPSATTGWGPTHVDEVLAGPGSRSRLQICDVRNVNGLTTGETFTLAVDVEGPERPLAVTLVWTDPPGAPGAAVPMVNHLELTATSPDGAEVLAGNVFADGFSVPGPATTGPEPIQRVIVRQPTTGRWSITVTAPAVNVGLPGQGFAIVVLAALAGPSGLVTEGVIYE